MLIRRHYQHGVSLIELVIGLAIVAVLLAIAIPNFSEWIQNTQIRTTAEVVQNGLQTARTEAVRRNANVRFSLTDATGTGLVAWDIRCVTITPNCPDVIQSQSVGGSKSRVGIMTASDVSSPNAIAAGTGLPAGVTFSGVGRVLIANIGTDFTRADITYDGVATARRLVVAVTSGGQVRMCDPMRPATDPQGC